MLKRLTSIIILGLLLISCSGNTSKANSDTVKVPYKAWRITGRYPSYFTADVISGYMITQSNQFRGLRIAIRPSRGDNPALWHIYPGLPDALDVNADLPQKLHFCWVSYVDQTFYSTDIDVPLAIRQKMVVPHNYMSESDDNYELNYDSTIILGFGPGGNVIAWTAGITAESWTEFARVSSINVGQHSQRCPNPYIDGKIPDITPKAKQWLKQHGMPVYWQEKTQPAN